MLYYLWSVCSEFIKNCRYAGINIERGRHPLLTVFERPAWGHNPKPSHMSWLPKNCPVNFLFEKLKISQIVYASTYVVFFFKGGKFPYMRDEKSILLRNKIYDAKMINGFLQK
jgi:hypothetical protein